MRVLNDFALRGYELRTTPTTSVESSMTATRTSELVRDSTPKSSATLTMKGMDPRNNIVAGGGLPRARLATLLVNPLCGEALVEMPLRWNQTTSAPGGGAVTRAIWKLKLLR